MATKGRSPGKGAVEVSYTFDGVKDESIRLGFLAGPIHGVYCHCSGVSKPCLRTLLGERQPCNGCEEQRKVRWMGYVPLRRDDGRPLVVVISDATADVVDKIKPGSRVRWFRRKGRGESVTILEHESGREWRHYYGDKPADADLTAWLARLWRMPEILPALQHWFAMEATPATPAVEVAAVPPAADPLPAANILPGAPDWVAGAADAMLRKELGVNDAEAKRLREQRNKAFVMNGRNGKGKGK